ncbi:YciI family protein [Planotetraspora sp. A-T 1434]|uniref:YciI family protein n=1 Tax=Planotetraspora sp. A-T 1434 TaxID=2979219 RepID=UPI0021C1EF7E|nr:YciI family protein [Planotetraspora sp. A-T 1434]MCT9932122.1 YciI family protein [Planotetraspora sp. A-T 1434]
MKYLLLIYMNPAVWESLSEEERNEVFRGHDEFQKVIRDSGEMIGTQALADPSESATVRVRDGVPAVTDGPYIEAKEYLAGYYLVECGSKERAIELAGLVPDARFTAMEVRPIVFSAGAEI